MALLMARTYERFISVQGKFSGEPYGGQRGRMPFSLMRRGLTHDTANSRKPRLCNINEIFTT
jgi:hypothetical protein